MGSGVILATAGVDIESMSTVVGERDVMELLFGLCNGVNLGMGGGVGSRWWTGSRV